MQCILVGVNDVSDFGYPHEYVSLYECTCGAEIAHTQTFTDQYDSGDGGELDLTCECGRYYKRVYRVLEAGGRYKGYMAKRFEWPATPGRVTVKLL